LTDHSTFDRLRVVTLGKTLKKLRAAEGIGIKTLAPRLGVDHTYLSKLENDRAVPSKEVVDRIAQYFNYDSDELMILAGRIPQDVQQILRDNPREAIEFLRRRFLGVSGRSSSRKLH
jgi:transcriptional regulator with XRE-family HTH domain